MRKQSKLEEKAKCGSSTDFNTDTSMGQRESNIFKELFRHPTTSEVIPKQA